MKQNPRKNGLEKSMNAKRLVLFAGVVTILFGCSAQQAYYGLQQNMKNNCQKIMDNHEYQACMKGADIRYENYEKARQGL